MALYTYTSEEASGTASRIVIVHVHNVGMVLYHARVLGILHALSMIAL